MVEVTSEIRTTDGIIPNVVDFTIDEQGVFFTTKSEESCPECDGEHTTTGEGFIPLEKVEGVIPHNA